MKLDTTRKQQILYYLAGAAICLASLLLRIYWIGVQPEATNAFGSILRSLVGGLPWISVAGVIVLWRAKGRGVHPLAFLFGTASSLLLAFLWLLWIRQSV